MSELNINIAAKAFADWAKPWTFYEVASAHEALSDTDREVLGAIWIEACNASHWNLGPFPQGCGAADQALSVQFPWLSADARAQVVRAASYQWR